MLECHNRGTCSACTICPLLAAGGMALPGMWAHAAWSLVDAADLQGGSHRSRRIASAAAVAVSGAG